MNGQLRYVTAAAVTIALLFAAAAPAPGAKPAASGAPAQAGKIRVLVVTGGHKYDKKVFPRIFTGHDDMQVTFHEHKKGRPHLFDDVSAWAHDVMVLYNFKQRLSTAQRANFIKLLERGVGLVVMHHAIAAYSEWREYPKIIGATYVLRKGVVRDGVKYERPVWKHGVKMKLHIEDPTHPITAGLADYEIVDETYKKWTYHKGNHLLISTDCPLNNRQIAWTRTYAKARVFFHQIGHGPGIFKDKTYRTLIARGIRWTARRLGDKTDPAAQAAGAGDKSSVVGSR